MHKALFTLDRGSGISLQDQLREKIATAIIDGYYGPQRPLPSTRRLAQDLKISRNTVNAVYQSLVEEGILTSRERSHYRVSPDINMNRAAHSMEPAASVGARPQWAVKILRGSAGPRIDTPPPDWKRQPYNFVFGELDKSLFPLTAWRHCSRQTLAKTQLEDWPWDQSGDDDPMLIEQLRRVVLPMRGIRARSEEILITAGTQNSIFLLASLLTDARTTVALEEPSNPEIRPLFEFSGAGIRAVPVDEDGIRPGEELTGCGYCYLRPAAQSPTVARLVGARRGALLDWAQAEDAVLLENDDDGEFNYRGDTMPALKAQDSSERVIYFASFRGILGAGIRLGYIVAPAPVIHELRHLRRRVLRHVSSNLQRTAAWFIAGGYYESTLLRLNKAYRARWAAMWQALGDHLPEAVTFQPPGGQGYWLRFPEGTDSAALAKRCLEHGVFVTGGVPWFSTAPERLNHLRIGFTAIQEQHIAAGIEGIAAALREAC